MSDQRTFINLGVPDPGRPRAHSADGRSRDTLQTEADILDRIRILDEQKAWLTRSLRGQGNILSNDDSSGRGRGPTAGHLQPPGEGPSKRARSVEMPSTASAKAEKIAALQRQMNQLKSETGTFTVAGQAARSAAPQQTTDYNMSSVVTGRDGKQYHVTRRLNPQGSMVPSQQGTFSVPSGNPSQFDFDFQPTLWQARPFPTEALQSMPLNLRGRANGRGGRGSNSGGGSGRGKSPGNPMVDYGPSPGNTNTDTTIHEYQVNISKLIPSICEELAPFIQASVQSHLNSSEDSQKRRRLMPATDSQGSSGDGSHPDCVSRKEYEDVMSRISQLEKQTESQNTLYLMLSSKYDKLAL